MTALRLFASVALLSAAGVLLFVAGFGIYFAISIASDGISGSDERERFTSALIEASSLPAGVALLIAGTGVWQRSRAFRPLVSGIGLMLIPTIAVWLLGPDRMSIPIGQMLALELPLALLGLVAVSWLRWHGDSPSANLAQPPSPVVTRGRQRRIASLVLALIATVPIVPLVFLLVALSFNPLEASDGPNVWAGIALIIFGIGGVILVIVAARALARPHHTMMPFVAVAACFALAGLVSVLSGRPEDVVFPILWSSLSLFLGWLSRAPAD